MSKKLAIAPSQIICIGNIPEPKRGWAGTEINTDHRNMAANKRECSSLKMTHKKGTHYHCCVPMCNSDGRYDPDLSFHKFPKDDLLKRQWIIKIRRDLGNMFHITQSTVVCSKHFKPEDYSGWTPSGVRRLKKGSIPTVFNWTQEKLQRRQLKRPATTDIAPKYVKRLRLEDKQPATMDCDVTYPMETEDESNPKIEEVLEQLTAKTMECKHLKAQLFMEKFLVSRFSRDDSMINFYTGFSTYTFFLTFFQCIQPAADNMNSMYYQSGETVSLAGRKRNLQLIDEFFMFMCRLRVGLLEQDLAVRFNCSVPTVSRKILTWVNLLYFVLGRIPIWLSRQKINLLMPECFKMLYPRTRVIIDCTELKTQKPSSMVLNSQLYSNYKSSCTLKCLLGIAPHGQITFISSMYTGCMSDIEITRLSGLLELLQPGDDVMADKGFTLKKILNERHVTLNIPPFLQAKGQFTTSEIRETEQIAKLRIHIERVNRRVKEYRLFDLPIPLSIMGSANQFWSVACMLANFKGPIVKAWQEQ